MTAPHYYASTSGILVDRFLKYGLFAFGYGVGIAKFRNHDEATKWAQAACALGAAAITTTFFGLESEKIDDTGRMAMAAAMGVDPKKVEFSDYKHSSNIILRKAHDDLIKLQWYRYGTDATFLLQTIVEGMYKGIHGKNSLPSTNAIKKDPDKHTLGQILVAGHSGWSYSPYASKAAYWVYETFFVPKTSYYDTIKLRENLEASGKDIYPNDLKGIYQRARVDRGLPMVGPLSITRGLRSISPLARQENDALRELLTRLADAYNKHDGTFGIAEIVYLIGENKINIHAADNKTFSPEAVAQSHREIDKVLTIGLAGICEENHKQRVKSAVPGTAYAENTHKSFTERVSNKTVNTIQNVLTKVKLLPKRPEEYLSERDPTNIMGLGSGIN